jgi:hypothetical protein
MENEFWRCILEKAYKSVSDLPDDINKMMDAPHFTELKNRLHRLYKVLKRMMESLEQSEMEHKLVKTADYFQEELDFDDDEAEEQACNTRSQLFKKLIENELEDRNIANEERTEQNKTK